MKKNKKDKMFGLIVSEQDKDDAVILKNMLNLKNNEDQKILDNIVRKDSFIGLRYLFSKQPKIMWSIISLISVVFSGELLAGVYFSSMFLWSTFIVGVIPIFIAGVILAVPIFYGFYVNVKKADISPDNAAFIALSLFRTGDYDKALMYLDYVLFEINKPESKYNTELFRYFTDQLLTIFVPKFQTEPNLLNPILSFIEEVKKKDLSSKDIDQDSLKKQLAETMYQLSKFQEPISFKEKMKALFWGVDKKLANLTLSKNLLNNASDYDASRVDEFKGEKILVLLKMVDLLYEVQFKYYNAKKSKLNVLKYFRKGRSKELLDLNVDLINSYLDLYDKLKNDEYLHAANRLLDKLESFYQMNDVQEPSEINSIRSRYFTLKGDSEGTYEDYTAALKLDQKNSKAYLGRALLKEKLGDISGAIEDLEQAIENNPEIEGFELEYTRKLLELSLEAGMFDIFEKALERGRSNLLNNDYEEYLKRKESLDHSLILVNKVLDSKVKVLKSAKKIKVSEERLNKAKTGLNEETSDIEEYNLITENNDIVLSQTGNNFLDDLGIKQNYKNLGSKINNVSIFNQVIGNARGKPEQEAILYIEGLLDIIKEANIQLSNKQSIELNVFLAELYVSTDQGTKAMDFIKQVIPLIGERPSDINIIRNLLKIKILTAKILLDSDKPDKKIFEKILGEVYLAVMLITENSLIISESEKKEVDKTLKNIISSVEKNNPDLFRNKEFVATIFDLHDLLSIHLVSSLIVEDFFYHFYNNMGNYSNLISSMLGNPKYSDQYKISLMELFVEKLTQNDKRIIDYLNLNKELLDVLIHSNNNKLKALSLIAVAYLRKPGFRNRRDIRKAVELDRTLENTLPVVQLLSLTYKFRLFKRRSLNRKLKVLEEKDAGVLLAEGDSAYNKGKYNLAILKYEKARAIDNKIKSDKRVTQNLSISYANEKRSFKEIIKSLFKRNRDLNSIKYEIEAAKKALLIDDNIANRDRLIVLFESLIKTYKDKYYSIKKDANKVKTLPDVLKHLSDTYSELGGLLLKNAKYQKDLNNQEAAFSVLGEAKNKFNLALTYNPSNSKAKQGLDQVENVRDIISPYKDNIDKAVLLLEAGEYEKALNEIDKISAKTDRLDNKIEKYIAGAKLLEGKSALFLDKIIGQEYVRKLNVLNDTNDPEYSQRLSLVEQFLKELSPVSSEIMKLRLAIFEEWSEYSDKSKIELIQDKISFITDSMDQIGNIKPKIDINQKDSFLNNLLLRVENLIDQGDPYRALQLLREITESDLFEPKMKDLIDRHSMLTGKCFMLIETMKDIPDISKIDITKIEALKLTKDKNVLSKLKVQIANELLKVGYRVSGVEKKDIENMAILILEEALKLDPTNIEAFNLYYKILDKDRKARIIAFESLNTLIDNADDISILSKIMDAILMPDKLTITDRELDILKNILERLEVLSLRDVSGARQFLKNLISDIRPFSNFSGTKYDTLIFDITRSLRKINDNMLQDVAFNMDVEKNSDFIILLANLEFLRRNFTKSAKIINDFKAYSDQYKGEKVYIQFKSDILDRNLRSAEKGLKLLGKISPKLTPEAKMSLSELYGIMAKEELNPKIKYANINRAIKLWPRNIEARKILKEYYEQIGNKNAIKEQEEIIISIENDLARGLDITPLETEKGFVGETSEHFIKAPLTERLLYFGMPLYFTLLGGWALGLTNISGALGLVTVSASLINVFLIIQLPTLIKFIKDHEGERKAAWVVAISSMIAPLLFNISPVFYLGISMGIHLTVNITVSLLNNFTKWNFINYATIKPNIPEMKPLKGLEKEYKAIIAVTGIDQNVLNEIINLRALNDDFSYITAPTKDLIDKKIQEVQSPQNMPIVLIEADPVSSRENLVRMVENAVRMSEIRILTDKYPVLINTFITGKDTDKIINAVSRDELTSIINQISVNESSHDVLKNLVNEYYTSGITADASKIPLTKDPEDWIRSYCDSMNKHAEAIKEGRDAQLEEKAFMELQAGLNESFLSASNEEIKGFIVEHTNIASMINVEDKTKYIFNMLSEKGVLSVDSPKVMVIDGRSEIGFDLKVMIRSIISLSKTKGLKTAVITDEKADADILALLKDNNIIDLKNIETGTPEEIILNIQQEIQGIPAQFISIATGESMRKNIISHIENNTSKKENTANFVIAGEDILMAGDDDTDKVNRMIPGLTAMNLIRRTVEDRDESSIVALAVDNTTLEAFELILKSLVKISRIDINAAIRSFIESLTAIATSV